MLVGHGCCPLFAWLLLLLALPCNAHVTDGDRACHAACGGRLPAQRALKERWGLSNHSDGNATLLLQVAQEIMVAAEFAVMTTMAVVPATSPPDLNSRVVSPKPTANVSGTASLATIYIDTNSLSRKYAEVQAAIAEFGVSRINLLYYDRDGVSYVAFRGNASLCSAEEAKKHWWSGWAPFYPDGPNTSFYTVIRMDPDWLEIVARDVQSGRSDWLPVTLHRRHGGLWAVEVPPQPAPSPSPGPSPSPSPSGWRCSVCGHVYDAEKDGGGLPFEQLPSTWKCPVCGVQKSAFLPVPAANGDGLVQWVHYEPDATADGAVTAGMSRVADEHVLRVVQV